MKKHTSETLKVMKMPELRAIAKALKINIAGKRTADIIRLILKKQANDEGKGTRGGVSPAPKKRGRPPKKAAIEEPEEEEIEEEDEPEEEPEEEEIDEPDDGDDEPEDDEEEDPEEDDDPEEEPEAPPAKKVTRAKAMQLASVGVDFPGLVEIKNDITSLKGQMALVIPLLAKVAEACDVDLPDEWIPAKDKAAKPEPKKRGRPKKVVEEPDEIDEPEEELEEDDQEEEIHVDRNTIMEADMKLLKMIAEQINEEAGDEVVDPSIKSEKILRKKILQAVEDLETEVEEEEVEDAAPDWIEEGAKVQVLYEEEWYDATIDAVNDGSASVTFDEDGAEADAEFRFIRPRKSKKKK